MSPLIRRALITFALLAWCGALLAARIARSNTVTYSFLAWNLFLAVIPAMASVLFARASARRSSVVVQASWFVLWLLFLPNAPYLITDFVHLRLRAPIPLWYDIALLLSCAATGLLLGYLSLADVQRVVAARWGRAAGWTLAVTTLLLSGFGIYLGRFLRWNSWDFVSNPLQLFAHIADRALNPFSHPRTLGVTVVYGTGLILGYIALRILARDVAERT